MKKIRVALASKNGTFIDVHFGKCKKFFIADIDADTKKYEIIETRECAQLCVQNGHTYDNLAKIIKLLFDCRCVIAARVGIWIVSELKQNGITPLEFFGTIDEAVKAVGHL